MSEYYIDHENSGLPSLKRMDSGEITIADSRDDSRMTLVISERHEKADHSAQIGSWLNGFALTVGDEQILINGGQNGISLFHDNSFVKPTLLTVNQDYATERPVVIIESFEDVLILVSDAAFLYNNTVVEKAARIWVVCNPNMMFVADYVASKQPVRLDTKFTINHEGNTVNINVYNQHRLVLRKGKEALKLFQALNCVDGKAVETTLCLGSNCEDPRRESCEASPKSASVYGWTCDRAGCVHQRIHTFMMDAEREIKFWHLRQTDEFVRLEAPDHENTLDFRFTEDGFFVRRNGRTRHWCCL